MKEKNVRRLVDIGLSSRFAGTRSKVHQPMFNTREEIEKNKQQLKGISHISWERGWGETEASANSLQGDGFSN